MRGHLLPFTLFATRHSDLFFFDPIPHHLMGFNVANQNKFGPVNLDKIAVPSTISAVYAGFMGVGRAFLALFAFIYRAASSWSAKWPKPGSLAPMLTIQSPGRAFLTIAAT